MATTSRSADLTSGPMLQKIILFSVPLAASSILQLLFNAADVVVVGRFAGSTALAAVGSNGSLINLLVNLFVGLSLGANVVAARCFGARDEKGVQDTVHTAVALGLVSGVLLAVVGFCAARGLLELMSCPEDVIDLSALYLKIYFIGMPMTMLYNFSSALLRAVGDTSLPVGILGGVNGQSRVVHLTVGDYAVLVSDGLLVDGPGWVAKQLELSAAAGEAPEKVAKTLVETARVRAQKTGRPDDITAAVLRLEKCV